MRPITHEITKAKLNNITKTKKKALLKEATKKFKRSVGGVTIFITDFAIYRQFGRTHAN
jgi:hypothetical protein